MTDTRCTDSPDASELLLIVAERKRVAVWPLEHGSGLERFRSRVSLRECCQNLTLYDLAVEETEREPEHKRWLVITERGERVAQVLKKVRTMLGPKYT